MQSPHFNLTTADGRGSEAHFAKEEAEVSGGLITRLPEAPAGEATVLPSGRRHLGEGPLLRQLWPTAFPKGRHLRPPSGPPGPLLAPQPAPQMCYSSPGKQHFRMPPPPPRTTLSSLTCLHTHFVPLHCRLSLIRHFLGEIVSDPPPPTRSGPPIRHSESTSHSVHLWPAVSLLGP